MMDEYIERESLKTELMNHYASEYPAALVLAMIDNQPTADVAEVRHGKWIRERYIDAVTSDYKCSVCDFDDTLYDNLVEKFYKYCPYCGARMDLE